MTRNRLLKTIVLLTLTAHASSQLIDFFQGFNAFLQPYQTTKQNGGTRKQASKPTNRRIDDSYYQNNQNSRVIDPFGIYTTTTVKPRKNRIKTTTKNWFENTTEKQQKKTNLINTNIHFLDNRNLNSGFNNNRNTNNRKVVNTNNEYNTNNNNQNNRKITTSRPFSTTNNYDSYFNRYTTTNPLLNRPGVRPAVLDDNRPPITNRPVTKRPIYFPNEATKRPIYPQQTVTPIIMQPTTKKPNFAPVSGPDFEIEEEPDIEIGPDEDDMSEAEKRRYLQIAEQKCDEYKSMNVKKIVALPLGTSAHGGVEVNVSTCTPSNVPLIIGGKVVSINEFPHMGLVGWKRLKKVVEARRFGTSAHGVEVNVSTCTPSNVPLIIGGKVVSINEFPHMGLVGWKRLKKSGYSWKCGGSLISEQHLLTAGHCTFQDKDFNVVSFDVPSGPPHAVQLGSSYFDDRSATVVRVAAVIRHAKYKLRRSYHDVALIRLATVVSFSDKISPACLGVPPPEGEPVIATGWGKTEFGGDSSYELRSVSVPIWNMEDCREIWGTSLKLPRGPSADSQLCAGEKKGGKDTCQGDSGGPAQVEDGCVWRVVAVTSVGRSCGAVDTPALYARVPRAFIASQAFANVRLNNNNNNGNNNRFGTNTNQNSGSNQYNGNNNQNSGSSNAYNVNNQYNSNNNRDNVNSNRFNTDSNPNSGSTNQYNNANYNTNTGISSNVYNTNNQNNRYNENNNQYTGYNHNKANNNRNYNTGAVINTGLNAYNQNNANSNANDNRNHNTNPLDKNVNVNTNQNTYATDNIYSTANLNNNQHNTNNRNQNTYNNNNRNDYSVITQPAVQTHYNQYSTPNNYNNNWSNYDNNNNSPNVNYGSNNNRYNTDYNSYTTQNYNRNNDYVNLNNNRFPIVATPWWSR